MLVTGEAGIGKTRLVEEATASLPAARVHWGRCHESEGAPAYWPWTQALRSYVRTAPADRLRLEIGHAGAEPARVVPAVRAHCPEVGAIEAFDTDPEVARFQLFDAVTTFLRAAATDELLVVVLDDLHWADSESLLLLGFVARELRGRGAARRRHRIARSRCGRRPPCRASWATSSARATRSGSALVASDVARYVEASAGQRDRGRRAARDPAHDRGQRVLPDRGRPAAPVRGAPLMLRRRCRRAFSCPMACAIWSAGGSSRCRPPRADCSTRRRCSAATSIWRSSPNARREAAARPRSAGPALAIGALSDATETPGRLCFAHALLQGDARRRPRRRASARSCTGVPPRRLEAVHAGARDALLGELAHHYLSGGGSRHAAAGDRVRNARGYLAYAQLGYEEAAGHFERALQASRTGTIDAATRLRLLIAFGQAQQAAGDEDGARATPLEAARLARELGDPGAFGKAVAVTAEVATTGLVDVAMIELLEEAAHRAGGGRRRRALHLAQLARALYFSDAERRHAYSAEALAIARNLGDAFVPTRRSKPATSRSGSPGRSRSAVRSASNRWRSPATGLPLSIAEEYSWRIVDHLSSGDMTVVDETMRQYRDPRRAADCRASPGT